MRATSVRVGIIGTALLLLALSPALCVAPPASDLPQPFRAMPMGELLRLFSAPLEPPSLAAEIARRRVLKEDPADEADLIPALLKVARDYPGTADARRSLLDIACIYGRKGEWGKAEAPFRYVMDVAKGRREARAAHLHLLELYLYAEVPKEVDVLAECQALIEECAGTPEEGLARVRLADLLANQEKRDEAFAEYEAAASRLPGAFESNYARFRWALTLIGAKEWEKARAVIDPAVADPTWGGRALWLRGRCEANLKQWEVATDDLAKASETADSIWVQGQASIELARAYAAREMWDKAVAAYEAALRSVATERETRLGLQIELVRALLGAGRYADAAQAAIEVIAQVDASSRYAAGDKQRARAELDPVLEKCRSSLSSNEKGRAGAQ